ncbi:serine/threonine-protein kinase [Nocardioides luteus]|uniref:non-specific serine/threonine protein kinase n=1 Tax=Nocardioides luteus TaxID=1844 RepID=A0ABQ5SQR9_9ACTN|nr:Stk1 family PASTA domain-containing Ser/Thr kinase [Nocardioides luteus]MDR7313040.1 serine/threonine-protein kinase [Nocardioides luteus]GGR44503.1 putative serine/threonine-protein kinase [Nocardioides luteus]GLJ66101.1 putative serine/threonine-protein kinase [Nocardioides luteus]
MAEPALLAGRYEVGELLGRGGMAEVRKGTDHRLGRVVAIKRLRMDLASDATFQARFRREAQSSAKLNHPSIVSVYDTGEEKSDDGVAQPYIVMEYVAGRTLRDVLREGRKILPERALEISSDVLNALDYSHRNGIIHRDIKPGNVMLTPAGDVKVMDFGIARALNDAQSTMTQTAAVVGTAQYLSPEQARGEQVDARSDVYSAGCLLYELLTGRPPFVGDSPVSVAYQHVREHAQPPSTHDPSLTRELDAIVMKSLAKRVEDRYQSAQEMRTDIERYLAGRPVQAAVPPSMDQTQVAQNRAVPPYGDPNSGYYPPQDDRPQGPRPWVLVLLGLVIIGLIAVGAYFLPTALGPQSTPAPDVTGLTQEKAMAELSAAKLKGKVKQEPSDSVAVGVVISQDPPAGQEIEEGETVTLTVSTGPPNREMPNVVGMSQKAAKDLLEDDPYSFSVKIETVDSDEPKGTVIESDPVADQSVTTGKSTEVVLSVSKGPNKVPNVVGKSVQEAEEILRNAGFTPVRKDEPNTDKPKDTVVEQTPGKGTPLKKNGEVIIFVSTKEAPLPSCQTLVPNPDDPSATATQTAEPGDPPTCDPALPPTSPAAP